MFSEKEKRKNKGKPVLFSQSSLSPTQNFHLHFNGQNLVLTAVLAREDGKCSLLFWVAMCPVTNCGSKTKEVDIRVGNTPSPT